MQLPKNKLEPLDYHIRLRDHLKSHERELWSWFASARAQSDYTESLRLGLLKSTYRLDADSHANLYSAVDAAKAALGLSIPVTVYQAQNNAGLNAAHYFIQGQGHIVFSGPVLNLLDQAELKSVLGHELAHYHLWEWEGGDLHIADRLLQSVASDPRAAESHHHTARHFQLYTEIFADRGSLLVTDDIHPVVASLVKIQTGLAQVSAPAYLKQADEIFAKDSATAQELSHPEAFIRARALSLWLRQPPRADLHIARMIEGAKAFDALDLLGQADLARLTRAVLECLLHPKWFQTTAVLGHARLFFEDFHPAGKKDLSILGEFKSDDAKLRDYLCYVLLDFVTADPELEEMPFAAALEMARELDLEGQFEKLAVKELKLKSRDVRALKARAADMLARAKVAP